MLEQKRSPEIFRAVELKKIKGFLDAFFELEKYGKDIPFSGVIPQIYGVRLDELKRYCREDFLDTCNGLMFDNCLSVKKVFGTVFLDRRVLEKIFEQGKQDVLIFSHHPVEDETSGGGFIPLAQEYLEKMREMRISVYSLHTPLDRGKKVSTARSLARSLDLRGVIAHSAPEDGLEGVVDELPKEIPFDVFLQETKRVLDNPRVNFVQHQNTVKKIGIVPGGGTDVKMILNAIKFGCDTYFSGEYYSKLQIPWGNVERTAFDQAKSELNINLVEGSHYSTERVVFVNELAELFKNLGMDYQFIEQENPWY